DGLGLDLLDAAARADRLIIETDPGLLLIGIGPFRVDRIGERRAGARNIERDGGCYGSCGDQADRGECAEKFQGLSPVAQWKVRAAADHGPRLTRFRRWFAVGVGSTRPGWSAWIRNWPIQPGTGRTLKRAMSSFYDGSMTVG